MTESTHSSATVAITKALYLPLDSDSARPDSLRRGVRTVEPSPDASHAIRGNLYILIELIDLNSQQSSSPSIEPPISETSDGNTPAEDGSQGPQPYKADYLARIAERLLGLVQTTYYTAKGSQSMATERAINEVHTILRQYNADNPQAPLRAGVTCASLLKNRLTITCSGPALALIASDEALEQFPWHQYGTSQMLGGSEIPEIHSHKRTIYGSVSLFMGSSRWLEHFSVRKLLGTVAQCTLDDCEEIAGYLSDEVEGHFLPALLVSAEVPTQEESSTAPPDQGLAGAETNVTVGLPPNRSVFEAEQPTKPAPPLALPPRKQPTSLPTSVNASPPVISPPEAETPQVTPNRAPQSNWGLMEESTMGDEAPASFESTMEQPAVEQRPRSLVPREEWSPPEERYAAAMANPFPRTEPSTPARPPEEAAGSRPESALSLGQQWQVQQERLKGFFAGLLPDRRRMAETMAQSSEGGPPPMNAKGASRRPMGQEPVGDPYAAFQPPPKQEPRSTSQTGEPVGESVNFTPPPPATGSRARLIITLAILLSFLVVLVVYATVWWQGAERTRQVEELIAASEGHLNMAKIALDDGNKGNARVSLQTAQQFLVQAEQIGGPQTTIDSLLADISQELSGILQVTPLYGLVEPLVIFPFDSSPHRVMVIDQDIYVLDKGKQQILRYRLDETRSAVLGTEGSIVLQQGQNVDGVTVGPLIDIAWQDPIPGIDDKSNLLVLDSNNNVFRYNQQVDGASLVTFGEQDLWQSPTQIQTYLGRFYIADGGRGQIYRYNPGLYGEAPDPWLVATNPAAIASISAMGIDGDIWLLFQDGLLLRYNQGELLAFNKDEDVGIILEPVDLFIGGQENSYVYLADAGEDRVLVFSKAGAYIHQLKAPEENTLQDLRGIFVDELSKTIYLLTKAGLFQHPLPE